MSIRIGQGTIAFTVSHAHADWPFDASAYNFGATPASQDGVFVTVCKHSDGSLQIIAMDGTTANATFRVPIPLLNPLGLRIVVTWNDGSVILYLQGQFVQTIAL